MILVQYCLFGQHDCWKIFDEKDLTILDPEMITLGDTFQDILIEVLNILSRHERYPSKSRRTLDVLFVDWFFKDQQFTPLLSAFKNVSNQGEPRFPTIYYFFQRETKFSYLLWKALRHN